MTYRCGEKFIEIHVTRAYEPYPYIFTPHCNYKFIVNGVGIMFRVDDKGEVC